MIPKSLFFSVKVLIICITVLIIFSATRCLGSGIDSELAFNPEVEATDKDYETGSKKEITLSILTQNTMLIPFDFVAPAFDERTDCVISLILEDYDIVCLQEVFNGSSQNSIVSTWHKMVSELPELASGDWQSKYFRNWFETLPDPDVDMWHPLTYAQSVRSAEDKKNLWGVKVSDRRPNELLAELICSPYYVMGPDMGITNIRQDGGLVILSRYPILECSAITYSSSSGSDRMANKGALYARIKIGPASSDYVHVFNTHIQAHDYSKARLAQIRELMDFISEIIKSDKDYTRPAIIAGDFNVTALRPDNWMELSDISPPDNISSDPIKENTVEYDEFRRLLDKLNLIDSWLELNPEDPGFTWIGKGWKTGSENPYGDLGNQIAIGESDPQRIDYIFYYNGDERLEIEPLAISLVPDKPETLYCFDKDYRKNDAIRCEKADTESDCSFKSYTVSDHLGLELKFKISIIE